MFTKCSPTNAHCLCFLLGPDEGKKYVDKTVSKHNEIVESIKELCNGLIDLETKLEVRVTDCAVILNDLLCCRDTVIQNPNYLHAILG